jgi:protein-tyrosine phosphatase
MVCMGNICRSPSAEGVLRARLAAAGLSHVRVDSAGTHDYHVGQPPDRRSQHHAARRGYDLSALRARQVERSDFERFDLILAMDGDNLELLEAACPPPLRHKLMGLMAFAPQAPFDHVPDPYYGGPEDFERVLDLVEQACEGLLLQIRHQEA